MRCRLQTLIHSNIADTHFNTENELICIFNDEERNTSSKVRPSSVSRNTIMRQVHQFPFGDLNIWEMQHFLDDRKNRAASTELKQICNSSVYKTKLIHNKANSSIT